MEMPSSDLQDFEVGCIESSSIRQRLIKKGLLRETSAKTIRNVKNLTSVSSGFSKNPSFEALIKPLKSFVIVPSPIRLKNTGALVRSSKTPECEQISTKSSEPCTKTHRYNTIELIQKACKSAKDNKIVTSDLLNYIKRIEIEKNSKLFEKVQEIIHELKGAKTGTQLNKSLQNKFEELDDLASPLNGNKEKEEKKSKSKVNSLSEILGKFKIRTVSALKICEADADLYCALLVLLGKIDRKKTVKMSEAVEHMEKFVSNPGIAVKNIKNIQEMIKEGSIDKDIAGASFGYFNSVQREVRNASGEMIKDLLKEVYSQFQVEKTGSFKEKSEENGSFRPKKIKVVQKVYEPLKLSLEKCKGAYQKTDRSENRENSSKSSRFEGYFEENSSISTVPAVEFLNHPPSYVEEPKNQKNFSDEVSENLKAEVEFKFNKDCKNALLQKFFKKNGKDLGSFFDIKSIRKEILS